MPLSRTAMTGCPSAEVAYAGTAPAATASSAKAVTTKERNMTAPTRADAQAGGCALFQPFGRGSRSPATTHSTEVALSSGPGRFAAQSGAVPWAEPGPLGSAGQVDRTAH